VVAWPVRRGVLAPRVQGRRVAWLRFGAQLALSVVIGVAVLWTAWSVLRGMGGALRLPAKPTNADLLDMVKIALSVVAGVGGVIALTVAWRKQRFSEAAEARAETTAFDGRFSTAADKLGNNESPAIRLAGVYALAQLADDWTDGRQTCIDVLCAYLRMPYDDEPADDDRAARSAWARERQVRHTVWRLIGNHLRARAAVSWRGKNFDFTNAFIDGADLHEAVFSGGEVYFRGAVFCGDVSLGGAVFSGSRVDFVGTKFSGGEVDFSFATFSGGEVSFSGTEFSGGEVNFHHAKFSGGEVNFRYATFSGGNVSFRYAGFPSGMDFLGAEFTGSRVDFGGAEFSGGRVDFRRAVFSGGMTDFSDVKFLSGWVVFSEATFSGGEVSFRGAHFSGRQVTFHAAVFSGGTVDLSAPDRYHSDSTPPVLDAWTTPPEGLRLPPPPAAPPSANPGTAASP
jgi:uncharacterized protein YjbI with pentapeptide repeats